MDDTFGRRLKAARKAAGYSTQQALGDMVELSGKSIRNYETGVSMPTADTLEALRRLLGNFDSRGDPVEVAVRDSRLLEWRQDAVLSTYKRHLHEQDSEEVKGA